MEIVKKTFEKTLERGKHKIIGILGGMGPQASGELYKLLIEKSIKEYGVILNEEFPEILIDSIPVPDFINNTKNLYKARKLLLDRTKKLNDFGVNQICLACNTAHLLQKDIKSVSKAPLISIIEEMKKYLLLKKYKKVGLLATLTTYKLGLYDSVLDSRATISEPPQKTKVILDQLIYQVISGKVTNKTKKEARKKILEFIEEEDLDAVILGCTELPILFANNLPIPTINSLDILASTLLENYYKQKQITKGV